MLILRISFNLYEGNMKFYVPYGLSKCFMFFLQIQFREKVLWTAITLFIFLVCCQVSTNIVIFSLGNY